jgi:hypothetical protein
MLFALSYSSKNNSKKEWWGINEARAEQNVDN